MIKKAEDLTGPRVVIFDLDGTLVEFHRDYLFSETAKILERMNHPAVELELLQSSFAAFDYFRFVTDPDQDGFVERFWTHFDWDNFPQAKPIGEAQDVLRRLRQLGMMTAVATARLGTAEKVRQDLEHSGLLDYLPLIVARESEETHWTDKRSHIEAICKHYSVAPAEAVMVGDIPADISSARAAGVGLTVAVLSGGIERSVLEKENPDHIIADISGLIGVLFP